jgi:hypothetical protein
MNFIRRKIVGHIKLRHYSWGLLSLVLFPLVVNAEVSTYGEGVLNYEDKYDSIALLSSKSLGVKAFTSLVEKKIKQQAEAVRYRHTIKNGIFLSGKRSGPVRICHDSGLSYQVNLYVELVYELNLTSVKKKTSRISGFIDWYRFELNFNNDGVIAKLSMGDFFKSAVEKAFVDSEGVANYWYTQASSIMSDIQLDFDGNQIKYYKNNAADFEFYFTKRLNSEVKACSLYKLNFEGSKSPKVDATDAL